MYLLIILFCLLLLFVIKSDMDEKFMGVLASLIVSIVLTAIITGIVGCFVPGDEWQVHTEKGELISLGDRFDSKMSSFLVLGTGPINSGVEPYYVFYYRDDSDGIRQGVVKTSDAVIYESDATPHHTIEETYTLFAKVEPGSFLDKFTLLGYGQPQLLRKRTTHFYVPEGSVVPQFEMDLE